MMCEHLPYIQRFGSMDWHAYVHLQLIETKNRDGLVSSHQPNTYRGRALLAELGLTRSCPFHVYCSVKCCDQPSLVLRFQHARLLIMNKTKLGKRRWYSIYGY